MKKNLVKILALCLSTLMAFSLFTACDCNETAEKKCQHVYENYVCTLCGCDYYTEGLEYALNEFGTGYIVLGKGTATDLTELYIPATHENLPVTDIKEGAFKGEKGIKVLNIADGVKTIGARAFYDCTKMEKARIPSTLSEIGESAFVGCIRLNYTTYGNARYLGNEDNPFFYLCAINSRSILNIDIDIRCRIINHDAFEDCEYLTYTEKNGFYYLGSVANPYIYLAKPVSTDLHFVEIDYNCSIINPKAISSLDEVIDITSHVGNGYFRVENGCLIDNINNMIIAGCDSFKLETTATAIGPYAFAFNTVEKLEIPANITSISVGAFSNCLFLTDVEIASSVKKVGENAFDGCVNLEDIILEHTQMPTTWHANWKGTNDAIVSWNGDN